MRRRRRKARVEEYVQVAERLRPYVDASAGDGESPTTFAASPDGEMLDELMQRAVTLLTVMPRNQHREKIEELLSPYDPERGRRTLDALIEAAYIAEDEVGHLRRLR